MIAGSALPAGYARVTSNRCVVTTLERHVDDARMLLAEGTLYDAAARDPAAQPLQGRGIAYAIALPVTRVRAVVRHNRHGGLLATITRDLFLPPTRAPRELETSLRLADAGIATPEVLMYGVATVAGLLRRSDVMTRHVDGGRDLSSFLAPESSDAERRAAWSAVAELVRTLGEQGVRHHDLNVKNILLSGEGSALRAWLLDVDRVTFHAAGDGSARRGNTERLLRSTRKWRDQRGAVVDVDLVARLLD